MKWTALFQIFILLASTFSVISLAPVAVEAQSQEVCCSETKTGDFCQYTDKNNCKPGALQAATSCEQTSFCQLGCGFDSNNGRCFKSTPKFTCQSQGDCTWTNSPSCEIPQCQRGCCVLSNQCSFVTQLQCKRITSQFKDINMTFDESITNELSCINQCRSFERGACVSADGSCTFTTRNACDQTIAAQLNVTGPKVGFHPDRLCSHPQLGTECAPQQTTGCVPDKDEVYWFDSCGNPENIYSNDKRTSYNNGLILPKEQSCNPSSNNMNSADCGNCNFPQGTLCGVAPRNVKPSYGDYTCVDLSCNDLTVSDTAPASKTEKKKLGESWCAYDGAPGFGRDFVGSRHYRRLCINGQELTEPCKDFREQVCVQGVQNQPPLPTQAAFELSGGDYIEALCRPNRYASCAEVDNQGDCENVQSRDCYWIGQRDTESTPGKERQNKNGKCVPLVSPGFKFWSGESTTQTSTLDPKNTCEEGNNECVVTFQKAGLLGNPVSGTSSSWKCINNCECLNKEYLQSMNNVCKTYGDCGAWFNIQGEFTDAGFDEDSGKDLTEADVERFDELITLTGRKGDYDDKFGAFFKHASPGLAISLVTGLAFGIYSITTGAAAGVVGANFLNAFLSGTKGFLGLEPIFSNNLGAVAARSFGGDVVFKTTTGAVEAGSYITMAADDVAAKVTEKLVTETGTKFTEGAVEKTVVQATEKGVTEGVSGTVLQAEGWTKLLQTLNTLAWIYTIYSLLDVILAKTKTETITTTCQPWVAPTGGSDCDKCNEPGKECSEYRCKSLGQLCKLLNPGTKKEACVNSHPNDVTSPVVKADPEALAKGYTLTESAGRGFILNEEIEPFTAVSLGVKTDEYAQCKFDLSASTTFDEMENFLGDSNYKKEHATTFGLPSILAEDEALKLTNGGKFTLYLRCQDGNGNKNDKPYYMKFAIKPGPDFTPPVIETTSIANGAYVPHGVNTTVLGMYVNEPSTCKWDFRDTEFEKMAHLFSCKNSQLPTSSIYYGLYECSTILTNIKPNTVNNYYFRCKDQKDNVNSDSYPYTLRGTLPLSITSISPTPGTKFLTSDINLRTVTAKGAQGGVAVCGYSFIDSNPNNAITFFKTNASVHEQPLKALVPDEYKTYITCADIAGNMASGNTTFTVAIDKQGPRLTNIATEGNILKISTDEPSTCEFSTKGKFTFGKGARMTGENTLDHETTLDSTLYYIVCRDQFENDASYKIFV